jgi:hypothetical protein
VGHASSHHGGNGEPPGPHRFDEIASLEQPVLAGLARHWLALFEEGRLPSRRHLRPAAIVLAMPYVALIDVVVPAPLEMTVRLMGTELVRWMRRDHTGRPVRELVEREAATGWEQVSWAWERRLSQRRPARVTHDGDRPDGRPLGFEAIALPLASDGGTVDGILLGLMPFNAPAAVPAGARAGQAT